MVDVSAAAEAELLEFVENALTAAAGLRICDAFDSVCEDLRSFPELGPVEADGETRALHRAQLRWVYEVTDSGVRLLHIVNPRRERSN